LKRKIGHLNKLLDKVLCLQKPVEEETTKSPLLTTSTSLPSLPEQPFAKGSVNCEIKTPHNNYVFPPDEMCGKPFVPNPKIRALDNKFRMVHCWISNKHKLKQNFNKYISDGQL